MVYRPGSRAPRSHANSSRRPPGPNGYNIPREERDSTLQCASINTFVHVSQRKPSGCTLPTMASSHINLLSMPSHLHRQPNAANHGHGHQGDHWRMGFDLLRLFHLKLEFPRGQNLPLTPGNPGRITPSKILAAELHCQASRFTEAICCQVSSLLWWFFLGVAHFQTNFKNYKLGASQKHAPSGESQAGTRPTG